jgi:hypothetical protein
MTKMMSPNTTIWWVPLAGITDVEAVTAAQINAGVNLSAAVATGFTLGATDSDTDDSKTIVDEANVETRTFGNYEGNLSFFRSDKVNVTAVFDTAYALFKEGRVEGYLVSRHGKKATATAAAGDTISIYHFISDYGKTVEGDGGAPIQYEVPFLPQGNFDVNQELAA